MRYRDVKRMARERAAAVLLAEIDAGGFADALEGEGATRDQVARALTELASDLVRPVGGSLDDVRPVIT